MTQTLYDDLWLYSERFTRDNLQPSELHTMACVRGLKQEDVLAGNVEHDGIVVWLVPSATMRCVVSRPKGYHSTNTVDCFNELCILEWLRLSAAPLAKLIVSFVNENVMSITAVGGGIIDEYDHQNVPM